MSPQPTPPDTQAAPLSEARLAEITEAVRIDTRTPEARESFWMIRQLLAALTTERARADRAEATIKHMEHGLSELRLHADKMVEQRDKAQAEAGRLREEVAGLKERHLVADGLPPERETGNSDWVAVWQEEQEQPQIRAYDYDAEHWVGGQGYERCHFFAHWAPLAPPTTTTPAGEVSQWGQMTKDFFAQTLINRFRIGVKLGLVAKEEFRASSNRDALTSQILAKAKEQSLLSQLTEMLPQKQASQFPGMPQAKCHGCGLPEHVARCGNAECPMKGGSHE